MRVQLKIGYQFSKINAMQYPLYQIWAGAKNDKKRDELLPTILFKEEKGQL